MKSFILLQVILILSLFQLYSQTQTNVAELQRLSSKFQNEWNVNRAEVLEFAKKSNLPVRIENDSVTMEMQFIDQFGMPQYYQTENKIASETVSTNRVNSGGDAGYSLDGSGMTAHEWDGGGVLTTHQEFGSRVTQVDGPIATHYHSTHVAGTMVASGVDPDAKGMAPYADLRAFDWNDDNAEMAVEAAAGALISNHSYGLTRGWSYNSSNGSWYWYGAFTVSTTEDYLFGFYDSNAADWDEIAYNAPYYLICKSAGNDRGDYYSGQHYYYNNGWKLSSASRDADGGTTGYDCIGSQGTAKNILTVGAVYDIPNGYNQPSDVVCADFSSWGPADDGRIKPDIVANGIGLYSTYNGFDSDYNSISGTSMATPNAAGSLLLLQEHFENLNGSGVFMRSATLKALAIHTADEAGPNIGPDYMFGWGLLNTKKAADKISEDLTNEVIIEEHLNKNGTYTKEITATSGIPIKATLVWTDVKGTPVSASLNPSTAMLVKDLDLRIIEGTSGTIYYPYQLDRNNPSNAATNSGENNIDNVEMVYIENPTPGETYTITVDHDGNLVGGFDFSLIISGYPTAPDARFAADKTQTGLNETVVLTDLSINAPTSWSWSISPDTYAYVNGTTSSSQNPEVEFTENGSYTISLTVSNSSGNSSKERIDYIFATNAPTGYCEAYSGHPYGTINHVQFGTIDNSSTYFNVGSADPNDKYYEDFTSQITDMVVTESLNLTVSSIYSDVGLDLGVWIDWNRDGDFEDTGENVVCEEDGGGVGTFSITAPSNASLGHTRMRIRILYYGSPCGSYCGSSLNGEVEDYTINIKPLPQIPPVAEFVVDNTSPLVNTTVNFTDQSTNVPSGWLWNFTPSTVSFVGGTNANSQNPQVEFTASGSYEVTLYSENSYGNDTEVKSDFIVAIDFPPAACAASGGGDEFIDGVQLNTINHSGSGENSYENNTSMTTTLKLLGNYSITVINGNAYVDDDLGVWADWNQDGDFNDTGENIVCEVDDDGQGVFAFTVPADASLGSTRLRIRIKWSGSDCGSPCGTTTYGEVEDYTLNIQAGTLTWDGSESTDWDDPDNWDGGVVPTANFHAIIPDDASVPNSPIIGNGKNVVCSTCTLSAGAILTTAGNLTLSYNK